MHRKLLRNTVENPKGRLINTMNKLYTLVTILFVSAVVSLADTAAPAESEYSAENIALATGDFVVVRPITLAGSLGGFGIFAVLSPFLAMSDSIDDVYDVLVAKPGKYTFDRDLGDFKQ